MMPNGDGNFPWEKVVHIEDRLDLAAGFERAELGKDSHMADLDLAVRFIEVIESRLELLNRHYLFTTRPAALPGQVECVNGTCPGPKPVLEIYALAGSEESCVGD